MSMRKAPTPPAEWWINQICATGGVDGSITMVVVFVLCLYCVLQSCLVIVTRCI